MLYMREQIYMIIFR